MPRGLFACFGKPHVHSSAAAAAAAGAAEDQGGAVLVELFSSQGCATSPEAELLLSRLGRGDFDVEAPVVVVLAHHVDYWDYTGWKDPFGSSQSTVRQKAYVEALRLDTMFTPQVVVQGRSQCVGTDQDALLSAIASAPRFPSPTLQANFQRPSPDSFQVSLSGALRMKVEGQANVMVALYENGLLTDCLKGENKGRVLSNDFVVRKLEKLCTVKDILAKKTVSGTVNFSLWEGFKSSKCGIAVFVQSSAHQIFGSQNILLPDNM